MSVMYTLNKYLKLDNVTDAYLWHCRLSHINKSKINRLAQEGFLNITDCESLPTCESCLLGKMTKSLFIRKDERSSEVLGRIHSDICGPMNMSVKGEYSYFIIFINDLSRYGYVCLMKYKSESFEMFKRFRNEIEKQTKKYIKTLWSNQLGDYFFNKFLTYFGENKTLS